MSMADKRTDCIPRRRRPRGPLRSATLPAGFPAAAETRAREKSIEVAANNDIRGI